MLGMFLGVFIIQIVENGLILMQVPVFGVETFIGIAVILFVILNNVTTRRVARQATGVSPTVSSSKVRGIHKSRLLAVRVEGACSSTCSRSRGCGPT